MALVTIWGIVAYFQMPKDIYPDLNAPLVNIITENQGMSSEDVERLISFPLESLLNGSPNVTRVRSELTTGDSVVTVEFDWGTDIYLARQIVSSKLELIAGRLPLGTAPPILGPVSSRMGEVFEFAVVGDGTDPMELRSIADWTIRYRLQGVNGVSFVINLGGFIKQFQVFLQPEMLSNYDITIDDVKDAIEKSNRNFSGGVISRRVAGGTDQGTGPNRDPGAHPEHRHHLPEQCARLRQGRGRRPGRAGSSGGRPPSYNGDEAVYVTIEKQYGGDTLSAIAKRQERRSARLPKICRSAFHRAFLRSVQTYPQSPWNTSRSRSFKARSSSFW